MTSPRFGAARITSEGLTTSWLDVPAEDQQDSLVLAVAVQRTDGSEVRFGGRWSRGEVDSPVVFAWDSFSVQERTHEAAETAITRSGDTLTIAFPRSWVDALIDAHELHAAAIISVDDTELETTQVDLDVEE